MLQLATLHFGSGNTAAYDVKITQDRSEQTTVGSQMLRKGFFLQAGLQ